MLPLQRLQVKVIKVVDVSYGGENGFNQAIDLAADALANVKFIQEKKLIQKYFDEISQVKRGVYVLAREQKHRRTRASTCSVLMIR